MRTRPVFDDSQPSEADDQNVSPKVVNSIFESVGWLARAVQIYYRL
jgi:hypothetical protein